LTRSFSPRLCARAAGILYLIEIALAFAVNPIWSGFIGASASAVTAARISAPFSPWRLAFAGELLTYVCYVAIAALLFALFRPVSPTLSLMSAFFMLTHAVIGGVTALGRLVAIRLSGPADFPATSSLSPRDIASLALSVHNSGHDVALVFFAFHCGILGYLIYRSGYVPRLFGALFALGSLCLLTSVATAFLAPAINDAIFPAIVLPSFVAQLSFAVYLTVCGVNVRRWPQPS
jgi:hypothetical protein